VGKTALAAKSAMDNSISSPQKVRICTPGAISLASLFSKSQKNDTCASPFLLAESVNRGFFAGIGGLGNFSVLFSRQSPRRVVLAFYRRDHRGRRAFFEFLSDLGVLRGEYATCRFEA
jgi:hypothetical protein